MVFSLPCFAVEQIDLTTPIVTPSITYYKIMRLTLDIEGQGIIIDLKSSTGQYLQVAYNGVEATTLMVAMNKMNFTTVSMQKKILQKLIADGKLLGTISGTPE
jgi:acyl-CoA thioesterase FadM